jgi:hypothetical protein
VSDNDYFLRRAAEELGAAERASSPDARRVHCDLANLYLLKIENGPRSCNPQPALRRAVSRLEGPLPTLSGSAE